MDDVADRIDKQVAIMSVLDLEDIADQTVSSQTIRKVLTSYVPLITKILSVNALERPCVLLQRAYGHGVGQVFDEALFAAEHDDLVCSDPERDVHFGKHIVD